MSMRMMVGSSENDELLAHLVVPEEQTRDTAADGCGGASAADGCGGASDAAEGTTTRTPRDVGGNSSCSSRSSSRQVDDDDDGHDDDDRQHRPGRQFLIHITTLLTVVRTTLVRNSFLKLFRTKDVISYCVSLDELQDGDDATTTLRTTDVRNKRRLGHDDVPSSILGGEYGDDDDRNQNLYKLNAFLEFDSDHFCWQIRAFLKREYDDNARIAVRCCHTVSDRRDFLHHATSNDRYILTNLRTDELNMNYRLCCWARRTTTFDYSDPFVVENRDRCRFLRRYLRDFQRQNPTLRDATTGSYFYSPVHVCYDNWTKDVCRWWNTIVYCWRRGRRPDGVDVDRPNRCLYVYGSTAAGKSTYVETILSAAGSRRSPNPLRHVYYPGVGRYFMRHFDANLHHAIVFEEFDVGQYNVAMLKRLCEGRNYSYPVSRTRDRTMTFRGPIIFVSPDDTYIRSAAGEPFLRRLFAVHAAVPYWHADRIIVPDSCYDDDDDVEAQASTSSSSDATMVLLSSASAPPAAVEHDDINIISESSSSDSSRTKSIEFGY